MRDCPRDYHPRDYQLNSRQFSLAHLLLLMTLACILLALIVPAAQAAYDAGFRFPRLSTCGVGAAWLAVAAGILRYFWR